MLKNLCFTILLSLNSLGLFSQTQEPANAVEIYNKLQALNTLPRVLYFAAHPDDENTGLLSFLSKHKDVRTAYLSLTRGDGGQNLLGSEQGAALGLIRTYELLEARKLDGAEQFFTRAIDFGFSKNPEDTFNQWDIDSVTADAVWVIRRFRPDIIICRFPPTEAAGHGQHSASAIIAEKAFEAAGDSTKFTEQLAYVEPYQPNMLLWNTFRFGGRNTTSEDQFQLQAGQYDPLLGLGYGELAGISRSLHKSQGAGTPSVPGRKAEYFAPVAGHIPENALLEGLALTWADTDKQDFARQLNRLIEDYDFNNPEEILPGLLQLRKLTTSWTSSPLHADKRKALDALILDCVGLLAEVVTDMPEGIAGQTLPFTLNLIARSEIPVHLRAIDWGSEKQSSRMALPFDSLVHIKREIRIPEDMPVSSPYWMRSAPSSPALYAVPADTLIGLPDHSTLPTVRLDLEIQGQIFQLALPLSYKYLDPVKGDVVEPLRIIPEIDLQLTQTLFFVQPGERVHIPLAFKTRVDADGQLRVLSGTRILREMNLQLSGGKDTILNIELNEAQIKRIQDGKISIAFQQDDEIYTKAQQLIRYAHLPTLQYFQDAEAKVIPLEIKSDLTRVGYLPGAGDFIPEFLELAGIEVVYIGAEDFFNPGSLNRFDAIVTGVRAANTQTQMESWMPHLLQYVEQGGTLLMQYNTTANLKTKHLGPYPFQLSRQRVTEEQAELEILQPNSSLLRYPFKLTEADFQGWVQERGLYFPSKWDENYQALFSMHDTGEDPLQGGLLYTPYGKGMYIYTGISFFRQLPAGNPGAAKLFLNLLSARQDGK